MHCLRLDLVCLSPPPLYTAPLFRFQKLPESERDLKSLNSTSDDPEDLDGLESDSFVIPHWIDLSFWHRMGPSELAFTPRAKMDDVQLVFMPRRTGDEIVLQTSQNLPGKAVGPLEASSHDSGVFSADHDDIQRALDGTGNFDNQQPFLLSVDGSAVEEPASVCTNDISPDVSPDRKLQVSHPPSSTALPISIRSRSRVASTTGSFDDRSRDLGTSSMSRQTPGLGTLGGRLRRTSPGKGTGISTRGSVIVVARAPRNDLNPYNPSKNQLRMTAHIRRWHHIFPKLEQYAEDDPSIKWVSLSTPACLPLTTDFFPTARQLAERYHEYSYILSPFVDDSNIFVDYGSKDMRSLDVLLMELVYHRLAQGFQIIVFTGSGDVQVQKGPSVKGAASGSFGKSLSATDVDRKALALNDTGMWTHSSIGKHIYLSLGDHVHHLAHDSLAQNVEVKRYVLKTSRASATATYHFGIWPKEGPDFRSVSVLFEDSRLTNYNWNYLDHLIAGYQDEMTDALRFWRTRFVLIPSDNPPLQSSLMLPSNETLDEEELRLAGFSKFLEVFEKARWVPPADRRAGDAKAASKLPVIQINLTTFSTAGYVVHEFYKAGSDEPSSSTRNLRPLHSSTGASLTTPGSDAASPKDQSQPLNRQSSVAVIAAAMQQPGAVPFKDRRWHFRLYEGTFLGSECVDWIIQAFPDIDSREAAVAFGDELLDRGLFVHVNQKHRFLDGYYYYRLKDEFAPARSFISKGLRWLSGSKSGSGTDGASKVKADGVTSSAGKAGEPGGDPSANLAQQPVELSRSLIVDMDPQKRSNRRELAIVHYDTVHNPKACYHFQLHWLSCTARLMEDMLLSWARVADKCGLRMVEAPVEQIQEFSPDNPFRSVSVLNLALQPPDSGEVKMKLNLEVDVPPLWFEMEFLRSQGFIIDVEADARFPKGSTKYSYTRPPHVYTQFVHRSGLVFVSFCACSLKA